MPDSTIHLANLKAPLPATARALMRVERDMVLLYNVRFGFPRITAIEDLLTEDSLVLVDTSSSEVMRFAAKWLLDHTLRLIGFRVYLGTKSRLVEADAVL